MKKSNNLKRMLLGIVLVTSHLISLHTQDLTAIHDTTRFLENPHKGWYHHYYDNGTWGYHGTVDEVESVPGLDFLYVRMAWSFFEKNEDDYDWSYISDLADTYAPLGYKIVVCFTSLESGKSGDSRYEPAVDATVRYATPSWVKDKGCNGSFEESYGNWIWQPDWDNPVYLAELEDFYREFYDTFGNEPWLKCMDVGSIGMWGEGHTSFTTHEYVPTVAEVKASIDIYNSIFQQNGVQVILGDDYLSWGKNDVQKNELFNYASDRGFGWTDWSIGNFYWQENFPATCGVHEADFFADSYLDVPVYMEMGHYHLRMNKFGTWSEPDGSAVYGKAGYGDMTHYEILKCQIETMHTSYASMHGDINEWLPTNPNTIRSLGNLMGYWYFPTEMTIPEQVTPGTTDTISIKWYNKGVAPAYNVYSLQVKIEGKDTFFVQEIENSGNMNWMDKSYSDESYTIDIPSNLNDGYYKLKFRLYSNTENRLVDIGVKKEYLDEDGFFECSDIFVGDEKTICRQNADHLKK